MASHSRPQRAAKAARILALAVGMGPFAGWGGELRATVRDTDGKAIADAVVVATPASPLETKRVVRTETVIVDQVNKEFIPYVLPLEVGSSVNFPNRDNIRHHVYSFSKAKRFELPLYIGDPAAPVVFDRPGVVVLGCNIHDWMIAYLYVTESPYFARTGEDGKATLANLPAGSYTLRAWHPRLAGAEEGTTQVAEIAEDGSVVLDWALALKPDFRIPRAPIPGSSGY